MKKENIKILVIDDEKSICEVLSASLIDDGYAVYSAHDGLHGLKAISEYRPDIVLLDIWMPGPMDGLEVLQKARADFPLVEFIIMSGHGTIESAVKATKLGAWDFIEKPVSMDKIFIVIKNILNFCSEKKEKLALLNKLRKNVAIIGQSPALVGLKQMISRVAPTSSWLLISGEKGTGRELVAQNIHYLSRRASGPFITIKISNIPEDLVEAELFGYKAGALIGSEEDKKGAFEHASGGVLFIDDVADLTLPVQKKLFHVLQTQMIQPLGANEEVEVDVRLIASTQVDIKKAIEEKKFLSELYERLSLIPFHVPSLREHKEDIPALVGHFSEEIIRRGDYCQKDFSTDAMEFLQSHVWPGNVRELKNFIERIYIIFVGNDCVDIDDLKWAGLNLDEQFIATNTFREARARFEKEFLLKKISENSGSISRTAEAIGLERSYLYRKIKAYGIEQ